MPIEAAQSVFIGPDRVIVTDDRLIVISSADMETWTVRRHRQVLIRFGDRHWRVVERKPVPPDAIRYELAPWDGSEHEVTGATIDYGADYVAERDRALAVRRQRERASALLSFVMPLTGFLTAKVKGRLEERYGIDSVASTWQSIVIEGIVMLTGLAAAAIGLISGGFPSLPFLVSAIVAAVDAGARWGRIIDEQRPPPGFYEWVVLRSNLR